MFMVFSAGALSNPSNMLGRKEDYMHPPASICSKNRHQGLNWWFLKLDCLFICVQNVERVKPPVHILSEDFHVRPRCVSSHHLLTATVAVEVQDLICTAENRDRNRWKHTMANNISFALFSWWRMDVCCVFLFCYVSSTRFSIQFAVKFGLPQSCITNKLICHMSDSTVCFCGRHCAMLIF